LVIVLPVTENAAAESFDWSMALSYSTATATYFSPSPKTSPIAVTLLMCGFFAADPPPAAPCPIAEVAITKTNAKDAAKIENVLLIFVLSRCRLFSI
jgi:hypothetical protein